MYEPEGTGNEEHDAANAGHGPTVELTTGLRLGQDVRFVLAAVGGGAVRIGREILRQKIRHLESIAINCDAHVQDAEEFERRIFLGPEAGGEGDTGGSPLVGGILARAAQPVLDRVFEGATFVTIIGSLGGGSGTGALPPIIDAAARNSAVLSVFVVKPFAVEKERRALADRALARLHFLERFVEKQQRRVASLQVLDNETLVHRSPRIPFGQVNRHWAELIGSHIETAFIAPAEAAVAASRHSVAAETAPLNAAPAMILPRAPTRSSPPPLPAIAPPFALPFLPVMGAMEQSDAELTFEVVPPYSPPPLIARE